MLPGVMVQVRGVVPPRHARTAATDARGVYSFKDFPFGLYELGFVLAGFESTVARGRSAAR